MAHELYLNNNNGNNHLSWSCQMLIKLHDACNGPHCPPRDGPKHPVFSPIRPTLPTSSSSCLLLPACPASLHSQGYAQGCKQQNYVPPSVEYSLQMGSHWGLSGFHFFTEFVTSRRLHINTCVLATIDPVGGQSRCQASLRPQKGNSGFTLCLLRESGSTPQQRNYVMPFIFVDNG